MKFESSSLFPCIQRMGMPAAVLSLMAAWCSGCWNSGSPGVPKIPPEEDLFLSYWRCADGLTTGLMQIPSGGQITDPDAEVAGAIPGQADILGASIDALCDELEAYQEKLSELRPEEIDRLLAEHSELVERVQTATDELLRRHAENPQILGEKWNRYRNALTPNSVAAK